MGPGKLYGAYHHRLWRPDACIARRTAPRRARRPGIGLLYRDILDRAHPRRRLLLFARGLAQRKAIIAWTCLAHIFVRGARRLLLGAVRVAGGKNARNALTTFIQMITTIVIYDYDRLIRRSETHAPGLRCSESTENLLAVAGNCEVSGVSVPRKQERFHVLCAGGFDPPATANKRGRAHLDGDYPILRFAHR